LQRFVTPDNALGAYALQHHDPSSAYFLEFDMTTRFIKTVTLLACAVFSTLALAADPPARVGACRWPRPGQQPARLASSPARRW
jgi:hypothetical protein